MARAGVCACVSVCIGGWAALSEQKIGAGEGGVRGWAGVEGMPRSSKEHSWPSGGLAWLV